MKIIETKASVAKYSTQDQRKFTGVECNTDKLVPAVYRCNIDYHGNHIFSMVDGGKYEVLNFPSAQQSEIISEIKSFWDKKDEYRQMGITFKRGILLYGPQGSGKTSIINILIKDMIERGGMVIDFKNARYDIPCIQFFRKAEPTREFMVILEDIDALFNIEGDNHESAILNLLDGIFQIDNVVFIATTNYPERLAERITDRPSRFDRVVQVDLPATEDRQFYLSHLINKMENKPESVDIEKWVKDTSHLSVAHLKELVVSVFMYGKDYKEALRKLDSMKKPPKVSRSRGDKIGFDTKP
jgi:SpoVK/Ycf46/Vps4 family AAA+-type ATPase